MDIKQLIDIGLSNTLAKGYIALLKYEALSPPELGRIIGESRTNSYSVLEKLVELKLAQVVKSKKKLYKANNPTALEDYVREQHSIVLERELRVQRLLPQLMNMYFKSNSEPGIRFFKGKDELKKIYDEQITSQETIYFFRSPKDIKYYGFDYLNKVRLAPAQKGAKRVGITPYLPNIPHNTPADDKKSNLERTWANSEDYTASVEWTIFGNKVSAISFGKESIGMIIESPQIAESMRQIFELAKKGAQASYKPPKDFA